MPRGYLGWGKSTQLGTGLGLAMGARLARPDWLSVNIMGDAAFGMVGMDFETAVRSRLPILTIVLNNGLMGGYTEWMPDAVARYGADRLGGRYAEIAQGARRARRAGRASRELRAALERCIAAVGAGRPRCARSRRTRSPRWQATPSSPMDAPDLIPAAVRARDLVGYGRKPPRFTWPDGARVVINLVLVYEAGSEYSVAWGDDRNDGWGEYADPGVQPPQRDPGTEAHYEYGSRAGVWRLARIFDEAEVPVTVSGAAVALELNPAVAEWMREHDHDLHGPRLALDRGLDVHRARRSARTIPARSRRSSACSGAGRSAGTRAAGRARTRAGSCRSSAASSTTPRAARTTCPTTRRARRAAMLVIPYSKTYNDSRFLMNPGFASPRDFLETLQLGLDELVREGDERRTMMTVAVHERWSGQAARAAALRSSSSTRRA